MIIDLFRKTHAHFIGGIDQRNFLYVSLVIKFIPLLTLPFIARLYTPYDFGLYAVYYGVVAICGSLYTWQAHQRICIEKETKLPGIMIAGHVVAVLMMLASVLILYLFNFFYSISGLLPYYFAFFTSVFSGSYLITYNYMLREKNYTSITKRNFILAVLVPFFQILFSFIINDFRGLILANLICYMILALHGIYYVKCKIKRKLMRFFNFVFIFIILKRSISFSFAVSFSGFINTLSIHLPILFVERLIGASEAGVLSMAFRLGQFAFDAVGSYVQDIFKSKVANNKGTLLPVFISFSLASFFTYVFIAVVIFTIFPYLVIYVLGDQWSEIVEVFGIVLLILIVRYCVSPMSYVLIAANKLLLNLYWQVFNIFCVLVSCFFVLDGGDVKLFLSSYFLAVLISYAVLFYLSFKESRVF